MYVLSNYRYKVAGQETRISTLSLFRTGIQPAWEDKVNTLGGDFCIRIMELKNMELLNKLWEELVLDVITKQFPFSEDITGVRILDKSRTG